MKHGYTRAGSQHDRNDLAGEHKLGDAGQIAFALLFAGIWLADTFIFEYTAFLNRIVPNLIRLPLGLAIIGASAFLAVRGLLIVFGTVRERPAVIRESVFGVVRHPIYLSEILLYLGLLMISMSLAAAAVLCATALFLHHIAKHEEAICLYRYGEEYRRYMRDVPMWVPRLRR